MAASRIATPTGIQVPLGTLAKLHIVDGPAEIKSENGRLTGTVYIDLESRDLGGYVDRAQQAIGAQVKL